MFTLIKRNWVEIFYFVLALLLIYSLTFFHHPLLERADTMFHYNRLNILIEALKNGTYPAYIDYSAINGYGYLINTFYPDFTLLPFAIIGLFTSLKNTFLSLILISSLCTFYFTYSSIKCIFKSRSIAYVAALLYTFCLYRLFDVYYRGAIAEYLAFTFLPIVLLGIYQVSNANYKKWYILTIGCFLLLQTHLITTAIVAVALLVYILFNIKNYIQEKKRILYLFISFFATILLSIGFLLPFVEQLSSNQFYLTSQPSTDIQYSLVTMNKILEGMLNTVYSSDNPSPNPALGGLLLFPLIARFFIRQKKSQLLYVDIATIISFVLVFSANTYFPWHYIPFRFFNFIQHPTRLLILSSFIFAIASSYYMYQIDINKNVRKWIPCIFVILAFLIVKTNANNYYNIFKLTGTIDNHIEKGLSIGGAEYLPAQVPSLTDLWNTPRELVYNKENIKITNIDLNKRDVGFEILNLSYKDSIMIPLTYYKGYDIVANDEKLDYTESGNGRIRIEVDKPSIVSIIYTGTSLQHISYYLGCIFMLIFVVFVSLKTFNSRKK